MKQISYLFLLLAIFFGMSSLQAFAECIPGEDPCAPKKKLNEWDSSLLFGFNLTQGNSETMLLGIGGKAQKEENNNIWNFGALYNYGEDKTNKNDSEESDTTRNDFRANAKYDYLFSERAFVGIGTAFLHDEISDIDYRVTIDPAPGYYFLKDNTFKFSAEIGPSYVFEKQGGEEDDYLAPRVAEKFEWAITCSSKVFQLAELYYDVSDSENVLVNAEAGIEAAISTNLALVFSVRENYDNVPAVGFDRSDLAVMTSLKVAL